MIVILAGQKSDITLKLIMKQTELDDKFLEKQFTLNFISKKMLQILMKSGMVGNVLRKFYMNTYG